MGRFEKRKRKRKGGCRIRASRHGFSLRAELVGLLYIVMLITWAVSAGPEKTSKTERKGKERKGKDCCIIKRKSLIKVRVGYKGPN